MPNAKCQMTQAGRWVAALIFGAMAAIAERIGWRCGAVIMAAVAGVLLANWLEAGRRPGPNRQSNNAHRRSNDG